MEWFKVKSKRTITVPAKKKGETKEETIEFESEVLGRLDQFVSGVPKSKFLLYDDTTEKPAFVWVPMENCELLETSEG